MHHNLDQYRKYISILAESGSSETFLNSSSAHAACVMSNIFKKSSKEVLILAGDLNGKISTKEEYFIELINFLRRGGKVKYLLNDYDRDKYIPLFFLLNDDEFKTQVEIKYIQDNHIHIHFAIGDDSMYRLEHDTKNFLATGSFNSKKNVQTLNEIFWRYYKDATKIDIKAHLS